MANILKLLAGFFAIVILGLASMLLGDLPGSAASAQKRLQDAADRNLAGTGANWAEISMQGQKAVIRGAAPSGDARDALVAALSQSAGPGGLLLGGVTVLDAGEVVVTALPPEASPYLLIAERQGDVVLVSGHAPSEGHKNDLLAHARLRFPDAEIIETLEIARGAPDEAQWLTAASVSLNALARLQNGAVHGADEQFTVAGEAGSSETASDIALLMSVLPAPFAGDADIRVAGVAAVPTDAQGDAEREQVAEAGPPAADPRPAPAVETAETNAANERAALQACRARLADALDGQTISFASARSELDDPSRRRLGAVADILAACPQFHLRIAGHTDSSGNPTRNLLLSEYRAEAVAAYLTTLGVAPGRLETFGLGDAEPLFDNETPEGRAGNRRIDLAAFLPAQSRME